MDIIPILTSCASQQVKGYVCMRERDEHQMNCNMRDYMYCVCTVSVFLCVCVQRLFCQAEVIFNGRLLEGRAASRSRGHCGLQVTGRKLSLIRSFWALLIIFKSCWNVDYMFQIYNMFQHTEGCTLIEAILSLSLMNQLPPNWFS